MKIEVKTSELTFDASGEITAAELRHQIATLMENSSQDNLCSGTKICSLPCGKRVTGLADSCQCGDSDGPCMNITCPGLGCHNIRICCD